MGTYRKIEVKMWSDARFRRLSPMPPCAQALWIYVLTGPHTTSLPCASRASRLAMAEDLGWPLDAFDTAFAELVAEGMVRADFSARVILIPNACKYNRPNGPNAVIAWGKAWSDLPDCALKTEALECVRECISEEKEAFHQAFAKAFQMPSSMPSRMASEMPSSMMSGMSSEMPSSIHNITEQSTNLSKEGSLPRCNTPPGKIVHLTRTRGAQDFENGGCA